MALSSLQLEAFYTCAQAGSFTLAAERLHITQSALSQRILNLESELSVSLFIRDRQQLKLTEFGEKLLRHCQTAESLESDLLRDLKSQNKIQGEIRIAGYSSVGTSIVLPRLTPVLKKYPELYFKYQDFELYELEAKLRSGEFSYLPEHVLDPKDKNLKIHKTVKTSNPIVLQFFRQSFYSRLHDEIVAAITQ